MKTIKKETIETVSTIMGLLSAGFSSYAITKLLTTILLPKSIGLKIGFTVIGAVISRKLGDCVENEVDEILTQFNDAISKANEKLLEETATMVTVTDTETDE